MLIHANQIKMPEIKLGLQFWLRI